MSGTLEGIGARLQTDGEYTKVVSIVPGGPAWKQKELEKVTVLTIFQSQAIDTIISPIEYKGRSVGWIFVLEPTREGNAKTLGYRDEHGF